MNDIFRILNTSSTYQGWGLIRGNRTRMEYYTGVEANNPSGTTSNIKYVYYESKTPEGIFLSSLTQELTYDVDDNVLTVEAIY